MEKRTAIVFGATGLVGTALINELTGSDLYSAIKIFTRRETGFSDHALVEEYVTDLSDISSLAPLLKGDDLYICLGTTIKKAGSVSRMEMIDRDLPVRIAEEARKGSVKRLAVVSSLGANSRSSNYYLRIKGEMEEGLKALDFSTLVLCRPSLLLGDRKEKRAGETFAKAFMAIAGVLLKGKLSKYKGIQASWVAKAMVKSLGETNGTVILESDSLVKIAGK
jgi:uncharacterized protein YbjT (DUF2867 family)